MNDATSTLLRWLLGNTAYSTVLYDEAADTLDYHCGDAEAATADMTATVRTYVDQIHAGPGAGPALDAVDWRAVAAYFVDDESAC